MRINPTLNSLKIAKDGALLITGGKSTYKLYIWPDGNLTFWPIRVGPIKLNYVDRVIVALYLLGSRKWREVFEKTRKEPDYDPWEELDSLLSTTP